jgi:orotate phosphoribosyltransferase-like protein
MYSKNYTDLKRKMLLVVGNKTESSGTESEAIKKFNHHCDKQKIVTKIGVKKSEFANP